jgi:hypothetical protein
MRPSATRENTPCPSAWAFFCSTVGVSSKKKRWEANLANIEKKIGFYEEKLSGGGGKNPA